MGELESVAKAKRELEEIYLGVPDDSVNFTFQDFVRQPSFNLSINSLGSDDNKLENEPIYATVHARLPSLDFKQALKASSSRYPTRNHNHSHSSCSPQQNLTLQEQLNLPIENPVKSAKNHSHSSRYPQQNHPLKEKSNLPTENPVKSTKSHNPNFRSPQQDRPLQEKSNLPTENPVTSAKSHSYNGHHDDHDTRVHAHQTINARHHHQHRKQILQRGHGGEAHGNNYATDMHDNVSGQHHTIPYHYDTVRRTSEMSTGSGVSATDTPPHQGRRRRPGTPHSKICTLCSTHAYIFRHRCLVCGRVYCRQCVRVGMGDMSEGRKCVECLGRRFSQRYIQRAGQMGCCMGYPSIVKQQELKWAEKGPKRSGDSRPERSGAISRSRSPAQTSPIITHSPGPTPSFGMESPYSPYTPTRHYPLPF
nr:Extra-large GTP-binding protein 3 [Ipomoea batatas]